MADLQIGIFSVNITPAAIDGPNSEAALVSSDPAVAGLANVELGLTLRDAYNNLVSGSYGVKVKADGSWFDSTITPTVFTDGVANITFDVTEAAAHIDIPVFVVIL